MKRRWSMYARLREKSEVITLLLLTIFVFALALVSPVTYASADSHFSLIVSQAILEHRTIQLDAYHEVAPALFDAFDYQVDLQNGHWLYDYPTGSSIYSLPFVGIALLSGSNMLNTGDNHMWQNIISALVVAAVFLAIYRIASAYLSFWPSLTITLVSMMGSTLISTLSTALWNLCFAVLFVSLGLGLIARYDAGRSRTVHPYYLGLILFASFLSRPSTVYFILVVLLYLAIKKKGFLVRTGTVSLILLITFLVFSRISYGSWLPPYYSAGNWLNPSGYLQALYGVLLSPSRGIIVYSPYLLLVAGGMGLYALRGQQHLLFWLCALWVGFQILSVSATRMWWGGYSFGPRLLTDAIPALVLMTAVLWQDLAPRLSKRQQRSVIVVYFSLGLIAIMINSYVGLFNIKTPLWNAYPDIDQYTDYLFDWEYPQFLITNNTFHERRLNHYRQRIEQNPKLLDPYIVGQTLSVDDDPTLAIFSGWWGTDTNTSWTEVIETQILFVPEAVSDLEMVLTLTTSSFGRQPLRLYLNDTLLGSLDISGDNGTYELPVDGRLLQDGELNELDFYLPGARNPSLDELVELGIRYAPHRLGLRNVTVRFENETKTVDG
ncbi:MAG TPA: hypothetical protein VMZ24_00995 [Patescibacteria group bacterium]|nr:hypothetical protein [Patescibacteria group bacterium]